MAMGLSNSTSFLRPITAGTVHAHATRAAPRPHHLGVGRALQRRRRPHVRGHAHDDRRAPAARDGALTARARCARAGAARRSARSGAGTCEGSGRAPKPVSGSGGGSGAPGAPASLIGTTVRAAAAASAGVSA